MCHCFRWWYGPDTVLFTVIDDIDREILSTLQTMGRLTQRELGKAVGLSPNAAGARMQRLIDRKIITGFSARIDHAALGKPIEASIDVWLEDMNDRDQFAAFVRADDRCMEAFHLTGRLDFRLRVRVATSDDLNALLDDLRNNAGVRQTDSRLVLAHLPTTPE